MEKDNCTGALGYSNLSIAADAGWASPWNIRGSALRCLGDYDGALLAYERAIALDPGWIMPKKNRDGLLRQMEEATTARTTATTPAVPSPAPTLEQVTAVRTGTGTAQPDATAATPATQSPAGTAVIMVSVVIGSRLLKNRR